MRVIPGQFLQPQVPPVDDRDARAGVADRIPICIEYSAVGAARLAARTATNVARARTSVPNAVASEAAVDQSDMRHNLPNDPTGVPPRLPRPLCHA